MNEEYRDRSLCQELSAQPYIKIMPWMTGELKLKGSDLTAFALLFERQALDADDAQRIDAAYLSTALGLDGAGTFAVLSALVKKGLVKPDFSGDGLLDSFKVDLRRVAEIVQGGAVTGAKFEGQEPDKQDC